MDKGSRRSWQGVHEGVPHTGNCHCNCDEQTGETFYLPEKRQNRRKPKTHERVRSDLVCVERPQLAHSPPEVLGARGRGAPSPSHSGTGPSHTEMCSGKSGGHFRSSLCLTVRNSTPAHSSYFTNAFVSRVSVIPLPPDTSTENANGYL